MAVYADCREVSRPELAARRRWSGPDRLSLLCGKVGKIVMAPFEFNGNLNPF